MLKGKVSTQGHYRLRPTFTKKALAVCIMSMSASGYAQGMDEESIIDKIVVYGQRASIQNAQTIKRDAATAVDAISSTDIGALPDKSVLESLQRLPGVAIERYAAAADPDHFSIEGSGITLRGLPYTRSEFNGRESFSANSGRGLSFQDVPPELMSKVEVFKNQTASMNEGGIAGVVNLSTRKPFDSNGRQLVFSVAANYADLAEKTEPSLSGLYSDRWDTSAGEFGFLLSLATSRLSTRTDGVAFGQVGADVNDNGFIGEDEKRIPTDVMVDGVMLERYVPINAATRTADQNRSRDGGSLVLQWANPDETVLTTFEYIRSDASRDWMEHNVESDDRTYATLENVTVNETHLTSGYLKNIDSYSSTSRFQDRTSLVEDFSLNVEFFPSDSLQVTADLHYAKAQTDEIDLSLTGGVRASTQVDFRSESPDVLMVAPDDLTDPGAYFTNPENFFWRSAMDHVEQSEGESLAFKLDLEYDIDRGFLQSVNAGVRVSEREQLVLWSNYNFGFLSEDFEGGRKYFDGLHDITPNDGVRNGVSYDHAALFDTFAIEGDHFRRGGSSGVAGGEILVPAESLVRNYDSFINATRPFGYTPAGYREDVMGDDLYLLSEINDTTESNQAIYGQLNFASADERITGNIGLRYVHVEFEAAGGASFPVAGEVPARCGDCSADRLAEELAFSNGEQTLSVATNEFNEVLPSLNVRFGLTDELVARIGVSKAIAFPDLGNLRNYQAIALAESTSDTPSYVGVGGNPFLSPMESINYDASLEWYFADDGLLFAGLFYKDMNNYFASQAVDTSVTNGGVTRNVLIEMPVNSGEAKISGVELGYQQFYDMLPAPFDGLGLQVNLTLLDVDGLAPNSGLDSATPPAEGSSPVPIFDNLPMQGLSEEAYNIVGMYEKDNISVRLAYNWRSEYLLTTRDVITRLPIYAQDSGQLDGSVFYSLSDNLKIGVEVANLLDEVTRTKMQVDEDANLTPRNYFINDRRFSVVLRGTF